SFILGLVLFSSSGQVFAQTPAGSTTTPSDGTWVNDTDVTFVGKVGARSGQFLDWTLQNYKWEKNIGPGEVSPISTFWSQIRNIVYAFFTLFVLITAFILVVTRGRSITIKKFIPRFILIVFLVTFSFALVQFIYQIGDVIQGFFFSVPCLKGETTGCGANILISQKNLLNIGFNYPDFVGYRKFGAAFDESAFISLLLIKLTAVTYYVMAGVLLIRKIILWFFIIISPIFPLLLLYSPVRNTGKIWVGEFFRWLLYAPLFAILLQGLVYVWKVGIPLLFTTSTDKIVYPTAINILLGGPGQTLSLENSVNNQNTFALYVVALLMLWVVIILPFLLLQIFLDYIHSYSFSENPVISQLINNGSSLLGRGTGRTPVSPAPLPSSSQPAGMARSLPFEKKISIPQANMEGITSQLSNLKTMQNQVLTLTNLSMPSMRDIAKLETASLSKDISRHSEAATWLPSWEKIGNPKTIASAVERQKYTSIKDKLVKESQEGNQVAASILNAASTVTKTGIVNKEQEITKLTNTLSQIANPTLAPAEQQQKLATIKDQLEKAKAQGDPVATKLVEAMSKGKEGVTEDLEQVIKEAKEKGSSIAAEVMQQAGMLEVKEPSGLFPVVNRVQQVSLDDYESVKKMWIENYQKLDAPAQTSRKEWVASDIEKINQAVNYLASSDSQNVKKGMESVGNILPFLLIGGFSQTEVIAYLKAKLEAAKTVLADLSKKDEEEDTMLGKETKKEEKLKEMTTEAKIEEKEEKANE
ncbi:hypothetical protein M1307_00215, partial [Patescibacteria group bacterium]|nr:hypothetical protein [Patescibacteria group bacterium]